MERLTERREDGTATGIKRNTGEYVGTQEMLNRLADYEDTGLAPEEVTELKAQLQQEREARQQAEKALELACIDIAKEAADAE